MYEIRQAEVGFFTSAPWDAPKLADQFRLVHTPGLPIERVQYWRLNVSSRSAPEREHMVLMTHYPVLPGDVCDAIEALVRPRYPEAILSFVRADSDGYAEVHARTHPSEVAAVVAEVKRSGSWDESPVFRIVVEAQAFDVTVCWLNDHAEVRVSEGAG